MLSSTSSSDWRRFFGRMTGAALAAVALLYAFIAVVDPWDILPLSPALSRAPVSTNARFSFPALARSGRFDSAVIGTSTSRLLRPADLDPAFGARFVNLSMNAATAYEQTRILDVFARAHPKARVVIIGLDVAWCSPLPLQKYTPRPFPEWMYGDDPWHGYREMFNLYALTEAWAQFRHVTGLKRSRYGLDGYTSFVPDDGLYDRARVAEHLRQDAAEMGSIELPGNPESWRFPALDLLASALDAVPPGTRTVLYFAPYNHVLQRPGSSLNALWAACKRRVTQIVAGRPGVVIADFLIANAITENDDNYWDGLHYRVAIGALLARDLAAAATGQTSATGDYALLPTGSTPLP